MDVIIQILWNQPQVRQSAGLGLLLALIVGILRARSRKPWVAPAGLAASLSLTLGVTLFSWRGPGGVGPGPNPLSQCRVAVDWASLPAVLTSSGGLLNIALFVPVGFFATMIWRRLPVVVAAAGVLSACIEITQAFGGAHDCTSTDTIANTAGALLGAVAAWGLTSKVRARNPRTRTLSSYRQ